MIIGVSGYAQTGKDTIADHLVSKFGFQKTSFAEPIKQAVKHVFCLSHDQLYGNLKEVVDTRWGMSPRYIMQRFGAEAMRGTFGEDIWIQRLLMEICDDNDHVIPDVRFLNEAIALKQMGGYLFRITRAGIKIDESSHVSECALDGYMNWDAIIHNDSTKPHLFEMVDSILRNLREEESNQR